MKKAAVTGIALAVMLCGCAGGEHGREPEDTVLVRVLGIDRMGEVCMLTAAGTNGAGETVIQTVSGESFAEAFSKMPESGREWISVKSVSHILLGDGVDPGEALSFILDGSEISWRTFVWYAPIAEAVMREEEDGGAGRLSVLERSGEGIVSVLDVLVGLKEKGRTEIPALTRRNGRLEVSGSLNYEMRKGR